MKRISRFDHFFLLSTLLLLVGGCGANNHVQMPSTSFSTSAIMTATRDLTNPERTIATRICYAYQSKNTRLKTQTYYEGTFNFNMSYKNCATPSTLSNYTVSGILTTSLSDPKALVYNTDTTMPFNKSVQTAQSGFLSQLCSKIQNNLPISNTATENQVTVQVAFNATDFDSYTLQYFGTTDKKIQSAETFRVRTQFNISANQILGMDEIYSKQQICSNDSTKFSELTQTYSNYLPK